jgi:hypothetical protein
MAASEKTIAPMIASARSPAPWKMSVSPCQMCSESASATPMNTSRRGTRNTPASGQTRPINRLA